MCGGDRPVDPRPAARVSPPALAELDRRPSGDALAMTTLAPLAPLVLSLVPALRLPAKAATVAAEPPGEPAPVASPVEVRLVRPGGVFRRPGSGTHTAWIVPSASKPTP